MCDDDGEDQELIESLCDSIREKGAEIEKLKIVIDRLQSDNCRLVAKLDWYGP